MLCERCRQSIDSLVKIAEAPNVEEEKNDKYYIPGYYSSNREPFKRTVHWVIAEQSGWISKWKKKREIVNVRKFSGHF